MANTFDPGGGSTLGGSTAPGSGFTFLGLLLLVVAMVALARGAGGKAVVSFLGVLLLSMILLNWRQIGPLLIK